MIAINSAQKFIRKCVGKQQVSVDDTATVALTLPALATSAILVIEADATSNDSSKAVRYLENGDTPTASVGTPLGNLDTIELRGRDNMANFLAIGIETGKTHTIDVLYYE